MKRPPILGLRFTAVVLGAWLSIYPLSYGPACWLMDRGVISSDAILATYPKLVRWTFFGPPIASRTLKWYAIAGSRDPHVLRQLEPHFYCGRLVYIDSDGPSNTAADELLDDQPDTCDR